MRRFQITLANEQVEFIKADVAVVDVGTEDLILYEYPEDSHSDKVVARFNKRFWVWYKEVE